MHFETSWGKKKNLLWILHLMLTLHCGLGCGFHCNHIIGRIKREAVPPKMGCNLEKKGREQVLGRQNMTSSLRQTGIIMLPGFTFESTAMLLLIHEFFPMVAV